MDKSVIIKFIDKSVNAHECRLSLAAEPTDGSTPIAFSLTLELPLIRISGNSRTRPTITIDGLLTEKQEYGIHPNMSVDDQIEALIFMYLEKHNFKLVGYYMHNTDKLPRVYTEKELEALKAAVDLLVEPTVYQTVTKVS